MINNKLIFKNISINLISQIFPIISALVSIPILIANLGVNNFGLLTLAWMITGYFGLLDLGLGRAVTKFVSEKVNEKNTSEMNKLLSTSIILAFCMGIIGFILLYIFSDTLVNSVFKINKQDSISSIIALKILSLSVPSIILSGVLSGVLQAHQRFDYVNIVRVPVGALMFFGPAMISLYKPNSLVLVFICLACIRIVETIFNFYFFVKLSHFKILNLKLDLNYTKKLFNFGSWMTVSSLISPLLIYLDRFFISSLISVSAVAYYAAPAEMTSKLMIIPGAIIGVMFPAMGTLLKSNKEKAINLYRNGIKYTFLIMYPIVTILLTFSNELLIIWLGNEYATKSELILQILLLGSLFLCFTYFPFALIHASGYPDLTAKIHVFEVLIYTFISWYLINLYGILGGCVAWFLRVILDLILLKLCVKYTLKIKTNICNKQLVLMTLFYLSLLIYMFIDFSFQTKIYCVIFHQILFFILSYFYIIDDEIKLKLSNLRKVISEFPSR